MLGFLPMLADTHDTCCFAGALRHCVCGAVGIPRIVRINIPPIIILLII
jgi:hypothetical protein